MIPNDILKESLEEFDKRFTDGGNGWSSVNIYRDGGRKIIEDLRFFLTSHHHKLLEYLREKLPKNEQGLRLIKDPHWIDIIIRKDGKEYKFEGDWIKGMVRSLLTKEKE